MDYQEFRKIAIHSADLYYNYLLEAGKGNTVTEVRAISSIDSSGFIHLQLAEKLSFTSDLQIRIHNKDYDSFQILVSEYNDISRTLIIRPREELHPLFEHLRPAQIKVISDLKFLVKRVHDWYAAHEEDLSLPQSSPCLTSQSPRLSKQPSPEQSAAIQSVLSEPMTYVWGAPGTGKTQVVLARAALTYCIAGKRILITAPTNNAVEQTLRGILPVLEEAGISLDKVLRLGIPSADFYRDYPMVCEARAIEDEVKYLDEQLAFYRRAASYSQACSWLHATGQALEAQEEKYSKLNSLLFDLREQLTSLVQLRDEKIRLFAPIFEQINLLTKRQTELTHFLNCSRSNFSAWLHRKKLDRATLELNAVSGNLLECRQKHDDVIAERDRLQNQIDRIHTQLEQANLQLSDIIQTLRAIPRAPFPSAFSNATEDFTTFSDAGAFLSHLRDEFTRDQEIVMSRAATYNHISLEGAAERFAELSARRAKINDRSSDFRMTESLIVAATVDGCINRLQEKQFHPVHVFLDEAAYCPLIKGVTLLCFNSPLTMLGDHMQLPPVCEASDEKFNTSDFRSVFLWAQSALAFEDVFHKSFEALYSDYAEKINLRLPSYYTLKQLSLQHTYRFGKRLAQVLAQFVYTPEFHGNEAAETKITVLSVPAPPRNSKLHHQNTAEGQAIRHFLSDSFDLDYAVLTPYRNQRAYLASILPADHVFTIHGSQGREWDTVIISVVETTDNRFLTPRLINTAVSRARRHLVLVCDARYWLRHKEHIIGGIASINEL